MSEHLNGLKERGARKKRYMIFSSASLKSLLSLRPFKCSRKACSRQAAFTLMEMVIAVTIFTIFMGMVVGVYLSFHDTQREVAIQRQMTLELEGVMDMISTELKTEPINYDYYDSGDFLDSFVKNRSGLAADLFTSGLGSMNKHELAVGDDWLLVWDSNDETLTLHKGGESALVHSEDTRVSYANFRIFPTENPYDNVLNGDIQFQPHVKIELQFTRDGEQREEITLDLSTTVTSRSYE